MLSLILFHTEEIYLITKSQNYSNAQWQQEITYLTLNYTVNLKVDQKMLHLCEFSLTATCTFQCFTITKLFPLKFALSNFL